jgi:hypothetical protein
MPNKKSSTPAAGEKAAAAVASVKARISNSGQKTTCRDKAKRQVNRCCEYVFVITPIPRKAKMAYANFASNIQHANAYLKSGALGYKKQFACLAAGPREIDDLILNLQEVIDSTMNWRSRKRIELSRLK